MSDEFDEVSRLMRLKRYEKPPEDYFDSFLQEFQERQRSELLNRSARSLFWERISTYFSDLGSARMAYASLAGAAACAVGGGLFLAGAFWGGGKVDQGAVAADGASPLPAPAPVYSPAAPAPGSPVPLRVGTGSVQPVSAQLDDQGRVVIYREF